LANFKESLIRIQHLQRNVRSGTFAVNEFADLSREEFRSQRLSKTVHSGSELATACLANGVDAVQLSTANLPSSWDWRNHSVVNPIKNQGQCGSCWAFSTIGVIESQWALAGNTLTSFSEQLLVDCSTGCCLEEGEDVCNAGCGGGWQWNAYVDIMSWGGVETETEYPYTAENQQCQMVDSDLMAPIKNYTCITTPGGQPANEGQMAAYLVSYGPIAIAMNAEYLDFYDGGVLDPEGCDGESLDHAIIIVGFGTASAADGGNPYWIVRNSWGTDWGEEGYFKIIRGVGACGLNNAVSSVVM